MVRNRNLNMVKEYKKICKCGIEFYSFIKNERLCKTCKILSIINTKRKYYYNTKNKQDIYNLKRRKTKKYKEYHKEYMFFYKKINSLKNKARYIISNMVRSGKIQKPNKFLCSCGCGKNAEQYHHPDYKQPLLIKPYTKKCHINLHRKEVKFW